MTLEKWMDAVAIVMGFVLWCSIIVWMFWEASGGV